MALQQRRALDDGRQPRQRRRTDGPGVRDWLEWLQTMDRDAWLKLRPWIWVRVQHARKQPTGSKTVETISPCLSTSRRFCERRNMHGQQQQGSKTKGRLMVKKALLSESLNGNVKPRASGQHVFSP